MLLKRTFAVGLSWYCIEISAFGASASPLASPIPVLFETNRGQAPEDAAFITRTKTGTFTFDDAKSWMTHGLKGSDSVLKVGLKGARDVLPKGVVPSPTKIHYFHGKNKKNWIADIPAFERLRWSNVYPGIDLECYVAGGLIEYDFIVKPGGDPGDICLTFEGAEMLKIDSDGHLVITSGAGPVIHRAPIVFQQSASGRQTITGHYRLLSESEVAFEVENYAGDQPLIIDPVVEFSTYLGGDGSDSLQDVDVAPDGGVVVTGYTSLASFPGFEPSMPAGGGTDIVVCKLSADGSTVEFLAYLGGSGNDQAYSVRVADDGTIFVGGWTDSNNFPLVNSLQPAINGPNDNCILQLSADGSQLIWSSLFGGAGHDKMSSLEIDGEGVCYFAGLTNSPDLPLLNASQTTRANAYIAAIDEDHSLLMCTYLGTFDSGDYWGFTCDKINNLALDPQKNVVVAGQTLSAVFPLRNAYKGTYGGNIDGFLAKINRSDWSLAFSTYLGGSANDFGTGVTADSLGRIYVVGSTKSTNFPLVSALDSLLTGTNVSDGFVSCFSANGQSLLFSTFLGEYSDDGLVDVTVNTDDEALVVGSTIGPSGINFSDWESISSTGREVLYARLAQDHSAWRDMAVYGGGSENPSAIAGAPDGRVYIVGDTSTNHPVYRAIQPTPPSNLNGFISCLSTNVVRSIPFIEDFEFGRMDSKWTKRYEARTVSLGTAHNGKSELRFSPRWSRMTATAEFALDLAGSSGIKFSLWCKSPTPEYFTEELPQNFSGNGIGSGIAFSADGQNWHRLCNLTSAAGLGTDYTKLTVNLDDAVSAAGLDYSTPLHFRIHAKQTSDHSAYLHIDDITVVGTTVAFKNNALTVLEGETVTFHVEREGPDLSACSVDFTTVAASAQEGINFTAATGTLNFAEGQTNLTFTVDTLDNPDEEGDLRFWVRLENPQAVDIGIPDMCEVLIDDDEEALEFPVRCSFESGYFHDKWQLYTEGDGLIQIDTDSPEIAPHEDNYVYLMSGWDSPGISELILPVDLSGQQNVRLRFYASRSAHDGGDDAARLMPDSFTGHGRYIGASISADGNTWYKVAGLTTQEGMANNFLDFQLKDILLDPILASHGLGFTDNMYIKFSMGDNNVYGELSKLALDRVELYSPAFEFSEQQVSCVEYDGSVELSVLRKGDTTTTATVSYATSPGTALQGMDYQLASGTLTFQPGEVSKTVSIGIVNDAVPEVDEIFTVQLSNPSSGFIIGALSPAQVLVKDDENLQTLPYEEYFSLDLEEWYTHGIVGIESGYLHLEIRDSSDPPSMAGIAVDPEGSTDLVLRFGVRYGYPPYKSMPESYTGTNGGDGVAVSKDGVTWYKALAFEDITGWDIFTSLPLEVELDSALAAAGITPGEPFKLRFEGHSSWHMRLDDMILYSRQPLAMLPESLPQGTGMVPYSATVSAPKGIQPLSWSVEGLPEGLQLASDGTITGTPTEEGSFTPTFQVIDAWDSTGSRTINLEIAENANRPPFALGIVPPAGVAHMPEQNDRLFTLSADDPEGSPLSYTWELDGVPVSTQSPSYLHATSWGDAGTYELTVRVSDGLWNNILAAWTIQVTDDNDGDGMPNAWERTYGLDPWRSTDRETDLDGDYLLNFREYEIGTSPLLSDSDGDTLPDGWEDDYGLDPIGPAAIPRIAIERRGTVPDFIDQSANIAAIGDVAYISYGTHGMYVVDANDPDNPTVYNLIWFSEEHRFAYDVDVFGERVYMADGPNGLISFDASDSALDLRGVGRYRYTDESDGSELSVTYASVKGSLAVVDVGNAVAEFRLLDVTEAAPDPFLGTLELSHGLRDADIEGTFVYLSGGDDEFSIVDISDPANPLMRGTSSLPVGNQSTHVVHGDGAVYLSWGQGMVNALDVSNPDSPTVLITNDLQGNAWVSEMQNVNGFIFISRDDADIYDGGGLFVYDGAVSDWSTALSTLETDTQPHDIFVTDDRIYALDGVAGLVIYAYVGDYDEDGLPDTWENKMLGSMDYGAEDDNDNDGISNLGEWRASIHPLSDDTDGDGLKDGWEISYRMNPAVGNTPSDTDGDGFSNLGEQAAHTDPLDASSYLRARAVRGITDNNLIIWSGVAGVTYRIDRSTDLSEWSPAPDGGGGNQTNPRNCITDEEQIYEEPNCQDSPVFYRIVVTPQSSP